MPRQTAPVEVTSYVKGLITEASPLTFPEDASVDEVNFVLDRDGTRRRRLGMDAEDSFVEIDTGITPPSGVDVVCSSYKWEGAGGLANKSISVNQVGNTLHFFDLDVVPLSSGLLLQKTFSGLAVNTNFSMTNVDGLLVVTTGEKNYYVYEFDGVSTITESTDILRVRDLFGVSAVVGATDLRLGSNIAERPTSLPDTHNYNLRNQTWGEVRMGSGNGAILDDPINMFINGQAPFPGTGSRYPANSDTVNFVLYPDANNSANRTAQRFHHRDLIAHPLGTTEPPIGSFIIDAMERGQSRINEFNAARTRALNTGSASWLGISTLPTDSTPGGASVVAEYAGRAWFAGFSSSVTGGDRHSPRMGSYILFSQLVDEASDIGRCYQEADPTSPDQSDIVDTDGGFIRLDGVNGILKMVNIGKALIIIATNGVWSVTGGSDFGFTATNYLVNKITDRGALGANSIVVVEDTVMYWGFDGIYHVTPNEVGDLRAQNLTANTIQGFYNSIGSTAINFSAGVYDSFERKVKWVYGPDWESTAERKELVLDLTLGAFSPVDFKKPSGSNPRVQCPVEVPPFKFSTATDDVVANLDNVLVGTDQVQIEVRRGEDLLRSTYYLILTQTSPTLRFTFGFYKDETFTDWKLLDGTGADAAAYLVTGYMSGGDHMREKQVPYIQFFFRRTEENMVVDGNGDLTPGNPSSCLVQAQWEWTDSASAGKWGKQFQAYRERRHYMPSGASDPYDTGFAVVTTRNKVRGRGKVLSLYLQTEPGKDLQLLGWSMLLGMNTNV